MAMLENIWRRSLTRRNAVRGVVGFLAASPLLRAQQDPFRDHSRVPAMDELLTALDFEAVAFAKLPREAYNYTSYGAAGEFTLRRNREAFDWVELVPKAVVDVSSVQTATEVLGTKMPFPIMVAPTAAHLALHPEGEAATHQGTTAANTPMIISYVASLPVEKIAAAARGPLWYQLYPRQEIEENREPLEKAQSEGCQAIVVTVDQQAAYYERRLHDRNLLPRETRENPRASRAVARAARRRGADVSNPYRVSTGRLWYEWKLFDDLRPLVKVPMLAKGILTAEDARHCIEHGLDGIVVSNHGGRALDYSPSTLEVLPEIVDAVGGKVPVLVDGGFRRGSDILKALALGASAVCLGRVSRWGLGAFGAAGVQRVLEILQTELVLAMAHTGRPTLASIDRTLVRADFP
jgi:4-hydroxymandelate oxidase